MNKQYKNNNNKKRYKLQITIYIHIPYIHRKNNKHFCKHFSIN